MRGCSGWEGTALRRSQPDYGIPPTQHGHKQLTRVLLHLSQLDPANVLPASTPYLSALSIPAAAAADRIEAKYLQLDPPEGKVSDRRKGQLALRQGEKDARRLRRQREADCGLVGKRRRVGEGKGKEVVRSVSD